MKVGIFTFHFAKNYGAMLQAYALCTAVSELGHDCEVVDYRYPWMYRGEGRILLREHYALHRMRDNRIVSALKAFRRWGLGLLRRETRQAALYHEFFDYHLNLSRRVRDWDLPNLEYGALICGSDQVWNARITGRLAAPYFLVGMNYGLQGMHGRRIAYAVSSGKGTFRPEARWISMFDAVGVRERKLAETVERLVPGSKPSVVLDPTFLLAPDHWRRIARKPDVRVPDKYLLLYVVEETRQSAWIYEKAREVAAEKDLGIVKVVRPCDDNSGMPHIMNVVEIEDCGPLEFLWLFGNAEAVFAGSFHATVFSILFSRDFWCIPHPTDRERTDSLLSEFGLSERTLEQTLSPLEAHHIDWADVQARLDARKSESLRFLKTALEVGK